MWNQMRMLNIGFDGYSFVILLLSCSQLGASTWNSMILGEFVVDDNSHPD